MVFGVVGGSDGGLIVDVKLGRRARGAIGERVDLLLQASVRRVTGCDFTI